MCRFCSQKKAWKTHKLVCKSDSEVKKAAIASTTSRKQTTPKKASAKPMTPKSTAGAMAAGQQGFMKGAHEAMEKLKLDEMD